MLLRWLEKADYIASFKEIELQQAQHLLQGRAQPGLEFQKGKEQIHAQGNPDLGQHRIAQCTQKRFDLELALDPFEKKLDLPALFV